MSATSAARRADAIFMERLLNFEGSVGWAKRSVPTNYDA
jgi:hypothetical protein